MPITNAIIAGPRGAIGGVAILRFSSHSLPSIWPDEAYYWDWSPPRLVLSQQGRSSPQLIA